MFVNTTQAKGTMFYTNWEAGTSGVVKNECDLAKNSFVMKLTGLVEASATTGYFTEVKRELDKNIYIQSQFILTIRIYVPNNST